MLTVFIVIAVLFIAILWMKKVGRKKLKGFLGELKVARVLGRTKKKKQYVIHNLLFENPDGTSCQIDHIYINQQGIWVIETKNRKGKIYGKVDDYQWTQFLTPKHKYPFLNPFKQNEGHIKKLSTYLKINNIFHNVVCFSNQANLSSINAYNLYKISELSQIKTKWTGIQLTDSAMEFYYNKLIALKEQSTITKRQHIKNIKRKNKGRK